MFHNVSVSSLEKLAENINRDIGNLNNGGCAVLAKIMNELFGYKKFLYVINYELLENDPPIHILTEINDDVFFDGQGVRSLQSLKELYFDKTRFFLLHDDEKILYARYNDLGVGLGVIDYKVDSSKIKTYILNKLKK